MATKKKMLQAAAGNAVGAGLNVEEVFGTYLYTGNGSTQTITNGIDLAGEGGMVWVKGRAFGSVTNTVYHNHFIDDTERGAGNLLSPNLTDAAGTISSGVDSFNSDGFDAGFRINISTGDFDYASWTFRKAPKFFDVIKWTGDGTGDRTFTHGLNGEIGSIVIKKLSGTSSWFLSHRSAPGGLTGYGKLDTTDAFSSTGSTITNVTSTSFDLGSYYNASGAEWVAYIFAHNDGDGEFGPNGDADIIKCGGYTGDGSSDGSKLVDLGFEPQWVMIKSSTFNGGDWVMFDNMRGLLADGSSDSPHLRANSDNAEQVGAYYDIGPTANGFNLRTADGGINASGQDYIYIAIRRGPMAVPESGDEVFNISTTTDDFASEGGAAEFGFVTDMMISNEESGGDHNVLTRLTDRQLSTNTTTDDVDSSASMSWDYQTGVDFTGIVRGSTNQFCYGFKRAPGFMDCVAYTGNGVAGRTVSHNLTVPPEMIWVKKRNAAAQWAVYNSTIGSSKYMHLDNTDGANSGTFVWNGTDPTATDFTVGNNDINNLSGGSYIAYLFASLDGVSKVGSYVGTGATPQNIDCGFTSGARFVLVKKASTTGRWDVFDTERGIVAAADPIISFNNSDAQQSSVDYLDPYSAGFTVNGPLNDSGVTWIFYAIA